ncbi:MAG: Tyrosine recombinase XerD [uncultured bacterium]|nr:MAG: Tyrosine recombinase XerD [uncultured bacterium]
MQIFEEYLKDKETNKPKSIILTKNYLKGFIRYVEETPVSLNNFSAEDFNKYIDWLINCHFEQNKNIELSWFKHHFAYLLTFFIWLNKQNISGFDLKHLITEESLNAIKNKIELKRQNNNIIPDIGTIFEQYKAYIEANDESKEAAKKLIIRDLLQFKEYAESKNKTFLDFTADDYEQLRHEWLKFQTYPSMPLAEQTLAKKLSNIKNFHYCLYNRGYVKTYHLSEWKGNTLLKYIFDQRSNKEPVKKRYYSNQEIIRAFKKYLNNESESITVYKQTIRDVYFFIEYLINRNKTIYKVNSDTLEEYKKYLLKYEYQPGFNYKPVLQLRQFASLKRFYNWLTFERYINENPLKDFKPLEYEIWLKDNIKEEPEHRDNVKWHDELMKGFLKYEQYKGLNEKTMLSHIKGCDHYFEYLERLGIEDIKDISKQNIRGYLMYLNSCKNRFDEQLSVNSKIKKIAGVKNFILYLEKFSFINELLSNTLEYPKQHQGLSTAGMTNSEISKLIESADGNDKRSLRDRTMFELLYSSGVRSNELCQLKINNINLDAGMVRVDCPKGGKDKERIVPIGHKACYWVRRYLREVRSNLPKSEYMFVNRLGKPFSTATVLIAVKNKLRRLHFKKKQIVTHSFRVACGTEMLKQGANLKIVQEQLGHRIIASTEKYIRLVPTDLKKAHEKYHPRS